MANPKYTCPHCGYDEADELTWQKLCDGWRGQPFVSKHYILDESRQPVKVCLLRWARWLENVDNRRVAETETEMFWISTVFLGLDHNYLGKGPPIIFETMVFTREEHSPLMHRMVRDDLDQVRYASWDDAMAGHEAMVRRYQKREADALARLERHIKRKEQRAAK